MSSEPELTLEEFEAIFLAQWRQAWVRSSRSDGLTTRQPVAGWIDSMRAVASLCGFENTQAERR